MASLHKHKMAARDSMLGSAINLFSLKPIDISAELSGQKDA